MLNKPYFTQNNRVSLIHNGQDFIDACCSVVAQAEQKVLFHTYAFEADSVTQPFVDLLIEKAKQGVKVFVIIDAIGSKDVPSDIRQSFARSGVHFCYFAPIISRRLENVGRRMHQKVLVVDNHMAIVGGINHCEHFILPPDKAPWLDYAVLLEGEEVYRLQRKVQHYYAKYFPEQWPSLRALIAPETSQTKQRVLVRTNVNDFMRFRSEIYRSHLRAMRKAKQCIQILATYFLPGKRLLKELKRARRRGVRVELIFSKSSDHPTERWSAKYLYSWYLKNGISVYEWDRSIIHGKVTAIDDDWVTLGSYNHNHLSRYINAEINLEIFDRNFASTMAKEIERVKSECQEITEQTWRKNTTFFQSLLYFFTYAIASAMTLLSAIIIIRRKDSSLNE